MIFSYLQLDLLSIEAVLGRVDLSCLAFDSVRSLPDIDYQILAFQYQIMISEISILIQRLSNLSYGL
jgi:hypothetical protein